MQKLTANLGCHLTDEQAKQVRAIAEMQGLSSSEYLRQIVVAELDSQRAQFERMAAVFGAQSSMSSQGTEGQ